MPPPAPPREVAPSEIALATGGFHTLAEIGEGGFGKVYRAMLGHQPVAIKVMAADGLQGASEFDNERRHLSRLSHAHLVRLLGVCTSAAPPLRCLVYELMPGGNVEEQLASQAGRCVLPWWLRLRVAAQVAAAVAYLHGLPASEGGPLLHRDIKPANMFLDGRLNAKLGDFGLAMPASSSAASAAAAALARRRGGEVAMVGTYAYLPPEYRSSGATGARGDVYALGVSLLQLATGALERLHDLAPRVRAALAGGQAGGLLDAKAGGWDEAAGGRLLALGLWAVAEAAEQRPSSAVLAQELARLWLAADQAIKLQQPGWGAGGGCGAAAAAAAAAPGAAPGGGQQQQQQQQPAGGGVGAAGGLLPSRSGQPQQAGGFLAQHAAAHGDGAAAGGGSAFGGGFWKFLTSTGPHLGRHQ